MSYSPFSSSRVLRNYLDEHRRGDDRIILHTDRCMKESKRSQLVNMIVREWNNDLDTISKQINPSIDDEVRLSVVAVKGFLSFDYILTTDVRKKDGWTLLRINTLTEKNIDGFLCALISSGSICDQTGSRLI